MKKLTKEEVSKFVLKRGSSSVARTAVMHMQPGEILLIEIADWQQQKGPGQMLGRVAKTTGREFKMEKVATGEGWIVERLK